MPSIWLSSEVLAYTCGNQACMQTQHNNQNHVFKEEACANRHLVGCPKRRVAKIHLGSTGGP